MSMMEYAELVKEQMESLLENVTATVAVAQNEGEMADSSITISVCEKGLAKGIIFHVAHLYKEDCPAEICAHLLCENYKKIKESVMVYEEEAEEIVQSYETAKEYLIPMLMRVETHEELLQTIPHILLSDMALFLSVMETDGKWSVKVDHTLIQQWGKSFEELLKQAVQNESYGLHNMKEVINTNCPGMIPENEEDNGMDNPLLVCTNKRMEKGAAGIFLPGVAQRVSQYYEADLLILPSSIHETLVIPYHEEIGIEESLRMVKEVNETCVDEPDILSESVYFYDRTQNRFRNMRTGETFDESWEDMPSVELHMNEAVCC